MWEGRWWMEREKGGGEVGGVVGWEENVRVRAGRTAESERARERNIFTIQVGWWALDVHWTTGGRHHSGDSDASLAALWTARLW